MTPREESGLGSLYDYNARFYSPGLGHFLSADTLVPDGSDPQSWNRFSYVSNNPLRYTDSSGHAQIDDSRQTDGWYYPAPWRTLQSVSRHTAVSYAASYAARNLNASPAPGVNIIYDGVGDEGVTAANHHVDDDGDVKTPDINEDRYISVYEAAFTSGDFVQNTDDLIGVIYAEIFHSHDEMQIESKEGGGVWKAKPANTDKNGMRNTRDFYGTAADNITVLSSQGSRYLPSLEIRAHTAALSLSPGKLNYSAHFRAQQAAEIINPWRQAIQNDRLGFFCSVGAKCN